MHTVINTIPHIAHLAADKFLLIAGPCVVENEETPFQIAEHLSRLSNRLQLPLVFKASYKKANRSSLHSFTGIGDQKALDIIQRIGKTYHIPTTTDVHSPAEAEMAAAYVDILQIPAFLCRQTDLLIAAAKTKKHVSVKKGQFLSPEAMKFVAEKLQEGGTQNIMLMERGTTFGYQDLVIDFRGIPTMQSTGFPVILDVTHSLQQPNQSGGVTGGRPDMIETIAKAGRAAGADGLFMETHPQPAQAKSDGANMLRLDLIDELMVKLLRIKAAL